MRCKIVIKGLMREAMEKNLFQGFLVGRNEVEVSILQYADDTLFFGKAICLIESNESVVNV